MALQLQYWVTSWVILCSLTFSLRRLRLLANFVVHLFLDEPTAQFRLLTLLVLLVYLSDVTVILVLMKHIFIEILFALNFLVSQAFHTDVGVVHYKLVTWFAGLR